MTVFIQYLINGISMGSCLRHHRPGLHHGLRHRQDAELRPRRRHHGGRLRFLLRHHTIWGCRRLWYPAGGHRGVHRAGRASIEWLAYQPLRPARPVWRC